MATITKRDLVVELSNRTGLTQNQVFDMLQHVLDLITEELSKGNEVTLRRFGTFEVRVAKPKIGRNPNKPGSEMQIPPRSVVRFKPGNEMKAQVASVLPKLVGLDGDGSAPPAAEVQH
jgi:nucleoid DNA-binding protein